jgi:hypothetical protein
MTYTVESAIVENIQAQLNELKAHIYKTTSPDVLAPATLPVDNKIRMDYSPVTTPARAVGFDDDSDDEDTNPMDNITPQQVQEVVTAFDELLRWKASPNPTMSPEMQAFIERDSLHRLSEAMRPLEQVARACG